MRKLDESNSDHIGARLLPKRKALAKLPALTIPIPVVLKKVGIRPLRHLPTYTPRIINLANMVSQRTRPPTVGRVTTLFRDSKQKNYAGWKRWYLSHKMVPERDGTKTIKTGTKAIHDATKKNVVMLRRFRSAIDRLDEGMVRAWVNVLVLAKPPEGLLIEKFIIRELARRKHSKWRYATPKEESHNIDGYIGRTPVQVKPASYHMMASTAAEKIEVRLIYYEKTKRNLEIYTDLV